MVELILVRTGDKFDEWADKMGKNSRLEKSGRALLRSICKLSFNGRGEYAKGDGIQIRDWLANNYPDLKNSSGRAELSKRQDWVLEVSAKILPLVPALYKYLVEETLVLDPNVLRDSVSQRLEMRQFQAYVHVNAIMWVIGFDELRFLTNSKKISMNPLEVNFLYENLWELGNVLKGPPPPTPPLMASFFRERVYA